MPQPATNTLGRQIDETIQLNGPLSLSTYMRLCLTHPTLGYYRQAHPIGRSGDFITAPEISQMFGEAIGLWMAVLQKELGSAIDVLELGPGRGTLMSDALRAFSKATGGTKPGQVLLLETNPILKAEQARLLADYSPEWIEELGEIAQTGAPLVIIGNEFFDALPIRQYQKSNDQWHERVIGLVDGKRSWGLSPTPLPVESLPDFLKTAQNGAIWETAPTAEIVMTELANRIGQRRGAFLCIDYGYAKTQTGDTFQALENHCFADPLANPGQADLTAHVDFEALATAAEKAGAQASVLQTQAAFLSALGVNERCAALAKANPARAEQFAADLERLVGPTHMGTLFKVLCISSPGIVPYPFSPSRENETP